MSEQAFRQTTNGLVAHCVDQVCERYPVVGKTLQRYRDTSLKQYVNRMNRFHVSGGYQSNLDFMDEVTNYTNRYLTSSVGKSVYDELSECPVVLTANHHGIDTFAQSTQTNLLFAMREMPDGRTARTVPVLACGSVPLNNLTYPRGFILYACRSFLESGKETKVPIFPDRCKRNLVNSTASINPDMVKRAQDRIYKLHNGGAIALSLCDAAHNVLKDISTVVDMNFTSYSEQATQINNKIWKKLFRPGSESSDLIYIEMEKIVVNLLKRDLPDTSSICHQLMFDDGLREQLVAELDGENACWQYEALRKRAIDDMGASGDSQTPSYLGTQFFWGLDDSGKRIPLVVFRSNAGDLQLRGQSDCGDTWISPFTMESITELLVRQKLVPSLFTCYLVMSIARGIGCIGGYYQADYLPRMQEGVIKTLSSRSDGNVNTSLVNDTVTDLYLSGMQTVSLAIDNTTATAGPFEIIASGGLTTEHLEKIGSITVLDAHIASLSDTLTDANLPQLDLQDVKPRIAHYIHENLSDHIVRLPTESISAI